MKVQQTCQARPILLVDVRWAERRIGALCPPNESAASEAKITVKDGARLSGAGRCLFKVCPGKNKLLWSQA